MSAATAQAAAEGPFNPRRLFWGIFASLLAAAGFFLLSTYAPDFRLGAAGGATPLSKSGIGFAGLAELMTLTGDPPAMAESPDDLTRASLLIVTIQPDSDLDALAHIVELRWQQPTLFVLPKWQTVPLLGHEGWETRLERLSRDVVDRRLNRIAAAGLGAGQSKATRVFIAGNKVTVPAELQWIKTAPAVIAAEPGQGVLIRGNDPSHYVLADPDFINNAALKDPDKAEAALALIASLRPGEDPVLFDLTLHGTARNYDLAKLLVEPPFLALTLTILAAAALAFLHGLARFGPARPETRAIPFGKAALVDTTAMLLRRAGRLEELGDRYAALMRARAGALLGAPQGLQGRALDQWLDLRDKDEPAGFTEEGASRRRVAEPAANA